MVWSDGDGVGKNTLSEVDIPQDIPDVKATPLGPKKSVPKITSDGLDSVPGGKEKDNNGTIPCVGIEFISKNVKYLKDVFLFKA